MLTGALSMTCFATDALAVCSSPSGTAGQIIYNSSSSVFQYCNDTDWIRMTLPGSGTGGCSTPTLAEGQLVYNQTSRTLQGCTGNTHRVAGVVGGILDWLHISAGDNHACGVRSDNRLFCWGRNDNGELGDGTTTNRYAPTEVSGSSRWQYVAVGAEHSCGIKTDGTMHCWGVGTNGRRGDNATSATQSTPVAVVVTGSVPDTWTSVAAGAAHTCGIGTDNTAWCWGAGGSGRRGDNTTSASSVPLAVDVTATIPDTWLSISAGDSHTCGIGTDATLWCWGSGGNGRRGDSSTASSNIPDAVTVTGSIPDTWKQVSAGGSHTCGIGANDTAWCWGLGDSGQRGDGTQTQNRTSPIAVSGGGTWKYIAASNNNHTCGIRNDDTTECWGINSNGALGEGTTSYRYSPTTISDGGTWSRLSGGAEFTCGIKLDGSLTCWGEPSYGQLGRGSAFFTARHVAGGQKWKKVVAGYKHLCAIRSDDTMWCWGPNGYGELGDGTTTPSSNPVQVSGGGTWKDVDTAGQHTCGIKSDDTLWCWGSNSSYELGITGGNSSTPVQVTNGGTWKKVAAGGAHSCGIKSDDTLWCWGLQAQGRLGDNVSTYTATHIPVTVSGGGTWKAVSLGSSHSCAIRSDDNILCWGDNVNNFQVGDDTAIDRAVPTAIYNGGTWNALAIGDAQSCGVRSDDTLWCWGDNNEGQLGLGDNSDRDRPTQVSGGGSWLSGDSGWYHSCAIRSDSSLRCTGLNTVYQLNDGTVTSRNVPTTTTISGTWLKVATGDWQTCGIKTDSASATTGSLICWGAVNQIVGNAPGYCPSPDGVPGDIVYNSTVNKLLVCDGVSWIEPRQ